jgi:hypothetical protein
MRKDGKNDCALAWHQMRMWWHITPINICKQKEEENSSHWSKEAIGYARRR